MLAPPTAVRCVGHVQDGSPCRREAISGSTVCSQHGGMAPQVRQRAAARIGNAADDMVKRLHAMLDDPAVDARDKIKIATDMLDRAGLNATSKVLVGVGEADPVEALFKSLLADPNNFTDPNSVHQVPSPQIAAWNLEALAVAEEPTDIVDAEVVEEPATVPETERMSSAPPKHIRSALERLI